MIICICNNLSYQNIDDANRDGYNTTESVMSYYKKELQCGSCKRQIDELLRKKDK